MTATYKPLNRGFFHLLYNTLLCVTSHIPTLLHTNINLISIRTVLFELIKIK